MINRLICSIVLLLAAAAPAAASNEDWDDAGTAVRWVLIGAALAAPAAQGDWNGELQALGARGARAARRRRALCRSQLPSRQNSLATCWINAQMADDSGVRLATPPVGYGSATKTEVLLRGGELFILPAFPNRLFTSCSEHAGPATPPLRERTASPAGA